MPASPIQKLVDTTGAGDLFAAGFLFGLVRNAGYENAGRLGALAAAGWYRDPNGFWTNLPVVTGNVFHF